MLILQSLICTTTWKNQLKKGECTEITQSRVILPVYACASLRCDIKSYRAVSTLLTTAELILQDFRFQCLIPLCCSEGACSDHSYDKPVVFSIIKLRSTETVLIKFGSYSLGSKGGSIFGIQ